MLILRNVYTGTVYIDLSMHHQVDNLTLYIQTSGGCYMMVHHGSADTVMIWSRNGITVQLQMSIKKNHRQLIARQRHFVIQS